MEKLVQERKDIAFYMVLFPLTSLHPDAYGKAKSIVCNKSIKMLGDAFAKKEIPKTECDTKEIDENIKVAETLGISGTPTLVSSDGRIRSGTMQTKQLVEFIEGPPKETPKAEK